MDFHDFNAIEIQCMHLLTNRSIVLGSMIQDTDTFLESLSLATMSIGTAIVIVMLSVSESAAASTGVFGRNMQQAQEPCCDCFDDAFSLLGTGVSNDMYIDSPWNDDNCDVFLDRSLGVSAIHFLFL